MLWVCSSPVRLSVGPEGPVVHRRRRTNLRTSARQARSFRPAVRSERLQPRLLPGPSVLQGCGGSRVRVMGSGRARARPRVRVGQGEGQVLGLRLVEGLGLDLEGGSMVIRRSKQKHVLTGSQPAPAEGAGQSWSLTSEWAMPCRDEGTRDLSAAARGATSLPASPRGPPSPGLAAVLQVAAVPCARLLSPYNLRSRDHPRLRPTQVLTALLIT